MNDTPDLQIEITNWEKDKVTLEGLGINTVEIPEHYMEWLREAVVRARDPENSANDTLLGQMKEEYTIPEYNQEFTDWIIGESLKEPLASVLSRNSIPVISEDTTQVPMALQTWWVNYQKKHEFNPPHTHSGYLSFVMFIKIPYDLEEEDKVFPHSNHSVPGRFAFISANSKYASSILVQVLNVDKSYENKIMIFRSQQIHEVFPFFTSDEERISVSGNIAFNIEKTTS